MFEVAGRGWVFGLAAALALVPAQTVTAFALRLSSTDVCKVWVLRGRFGGSAVALVAAYCALLVVPQALPEIQGTWTYPSGQGGHSNAGAGQCKQRKASAPFRATSGTVSQAGRVCPRALSLTVCVASCAVVDDLAAFGVSAVPLLEEAASGLADRIDHRRALGGFVRPAAQVREVAFGLRILSILAAAERLVVAQTVA